MIDLDRIKDLKVLFIGDKIVDEYIYVQDVGKAIKENALSSTFAKKEVFYGGVSAAHSHLKSFCKLVDYRCGREEMVNTRMVDSTYLRKLFVLHQSRPNMDRMDPYEIGWYDVVVVTDFGHGTMNKRMIEEVSTRAKFLAVNAQTNSRNFGFNMITKYPRADFVVVDELEARLAAHDRDAPIEEVIQALGFRKIIVTLGTGGAIGFDSTSPYGDVLERAPALTDKIVDSMGAGDAFLAVTAPYAAAGAPMADLLRIGNAAGAIKVGIIGHSESVTKDALRSKLNV